LWDNYSVPDVFADPFLDPVQRRAEAKVPPFHRLAGSVQLVGEVLSRLMRERTLEVDGTAMRGVALIQRALGEAMQLGAQLPIAKIKDDDKGVKLAQRHARAALNDARASRAPSGGPSLGAHWPTRARPNAGTSSFSTSS